MPVGPVAGGIMGCVLLLAIGIYCYRHHASRIGHRYEDSLPDGQRRLRDSANENDFEEINDSYDGGMFSL